MAQLPIPHAGPWSHFRAANHPLPPPSAPNGVTTVLIDGHLVHRSLDRYSPIFIPSWLLQVNGLQGQTIPRRIEETGSTFLPREYQSALYAREFIALLDKRESDARRQIWTRELINAAKMKPDYPVGGMMPVARERDYVDHSVAIRKPQLMNSKAPSTTTGSSPSSPSTAPSLPSTSTSISSAITPISPPKPALLPISAMASDSYANRFIPLLSHELFARTRQLRDANLYNVPLIPNIPSGAFVPFGTYVLYELEARSVREGWPPVDLGDIVELRQVFPEYQKWQGYIFEASIHGINRAAGKITLRCDALRVAEQSMRFNVVWRLQSQVFQSWIRAVEIMQDSMRSESTLHSLTVAERWLFPEPQHVGELEAPLQESDIMFAWVDDSLNVEQRHAVQSIVWGKHTIPFILSGPPGTGKTKSLVEAVLQILKKHPTTHILVCGASNPSADTLAMRLRKHLSPHELLRLNSPSRPFSETRIELLAFSHVDIETNMFSVPSLTELLSKRVIVTTCLDSTILRQVRATNDDLARLQLYTTTTIHPLIPVPRSSLPPHFGFLLIDESGQANEADICCPLSCVVTTIPQVARAHVTLCGDEKQLGPLVLDEETRRADFDVSLLERLAERDVYKKHSAARRNRRKGQRETWKLGTPFVDLTKNYRSCAPILMVPSLLFYNESLEVCVDSATQNSPLHSWPRLPTPGFPVWFCGSKGIDEPVDEMSSFYNQDEVNTVRDLILDLIASSASKGHVLHPSEISCISPFREQVWRIRLALRAVRLGDVDVGNVEALQGAENRVVIISTVRSRDRWLELDASSGKGLVHEPKRFNVAMTRAKELLIVVGNADILTRDPWWLAFYRFCVRNQCYTGTPIVKHDSFTAGAEGVSKLEEVYRMKEGGGNHIEMLVGRMTKGLFLKEDEDLG